MQSLNLKDPYTILLIRLITCTALVKLSIPILCTQLLISPRNRQQRLRQLHRRFLQGIPQSGIQ